MEKLVYQIFNWIKIIGAFSGPLELYKESDSYVYGATK